jgi:hypothetical protein
MKRSFACALSFTCLLAAAAWAANPSDAEKKSDKPRVVDPAAVVYDADQAFDFLKSLAGDWQRAGGDDHAGGSKATTFKVSAAGSAVVETIFPGQPSEMITVYHRNGPDLLLTHYCALWNAPVMKFEPSDKPGEIRFAFDGGTNFDPEKDLHVHEGTLVIKDGNTLEVNFVAYTNGKPQPGDRATLRRKEVK